MSLTFKEATKGEFRINEKIWATSSFSANSNQTCFQLYNKQNLRASIQQIEQRFGTNKCQQHYTKVVSRAPTTDNLCIVLSNHRIYSRAKEEGMTRAHLYASIPKSFYLCGLFCHHWAYYLATTDHKRIAS